jgi:hypothetical protein
MEASTVVKRVMDFYLLWGPLNLPMQLQPSLSVYSQGMDFVPCVIVIRPNIITTACHQK